VSGVKGEGFKDEGLIDGIACGNGMGIRLYYRVGCVRRHLRMSFLSWVEEMEVKDESVIDGISCGKGICGQGNHGR
jgi:hypothetical protein